MTARILNRALCWQVLRDLIGAAADGVAAARARVALVCPTPLSSCGSR